MISKNKAKYIRSLELKKNRKQDNVFVAEGHKLVGDLIGVFACKFIAATEEWWSENINIQADEKVTVTNEELVKISFLKHPQSVLAIFEQRNESIDVTIAQTSLCLALDDIQDPGNLGTIIRLADWFGIEHIFCSVGTVDVYSPKTIQATMGAIARVKLYYGSLTNLIERLDGTPIYGTFLDGKNMYQERLTPNGLIVMGNEGNGISEEVGKLINKRLYIPNYPQNRKTSESLNVAMATSIICAEFRRQIL